VFDEFVQGTEGSPSLSVPLIPNIIEDSMIVFKVQVISRVRVKATGIGNELDWECLTHAERKKWKRKESA